MKGNLMKGKMKGHFRKGKKGTVHELEFIRRSGGLTSCPQFSQSWALKELARQQRLNSEEEKSIKISTSSVKL